MTACRKYGKKRIQGNKRVDNFASMIEMKKAHLSRKDPSSPAYKNRILK